MVVLKERVASLHSDAAPVRPMTMRLGEDGRSTQPEDIGWHCSGPQRCLSNEQQPESYDTHRTPLFSKTRGQVKISETYPWHKRVIRRCVLS